MSEKEVIIPADTLETFVTALFAKTDMNQDAAAYCAEALVQTNLWGIDSHGVLRAPIYLERLISKAMNPTPNIQKVRGFGALEVLDGDDGMGFVVGREAMKRAIELAEQHGVSAVGVNRSNHFGAAALFAKMATEKGLIGIVMTNVIPNVVAPGGSKPITGNNPIAIGVPTFKEFPFMLDISLSNVAGGKLLLASKKGEQIPLDWATDKNGRPTSDPDDAFAGFLLPVGGHKGLGLSYVIDILSGLITGGVFQRSIKSMYKHRDEPSLTSHFMIVINPLALISQEEMESRMTDFYQTIKTSPMWDNSREMMLPGEIEWRTAVSRRANGIPLPINLYNDLVELGKKLGVSEKLAA
ncbi:MAG: Ldh family oxidoreductase [Chloroflexi bacterium]|nr:Ldh family oxidoreductase [Chloroflexota bacterium]